MTTIDLPALAAALAAVEARGVSPSLLLAYAVAQNIVAVAADDEGDEGGGEGIDGHFSMWSQAALEDGRDEAMDHVNAVGDILTTMGLLGDDLTMAARKVRM